MPPRRHARKPKRRVRKIRRSVRTRRTGGRSTLRNTKASAIVADRFITKMKYADRDVLSPVTNGITIAHLYNLNSIYDPDRTGTGHQPMGRDQLAVLYHRYRVFAVSWRVAFSANGTSGTVVVEPVNSEQTLSGQSIAPTREAPRAICKPTALYTPTTITGRISLPRLNGQTSAEFKGSNRFQALSDASPDELQTLQIGYNSIGSLTSISYDIQLTYHVEWFDPLPVGPS